MKTSNTATVTPSESRNPASGNFCIASSSIDFLSPLSAAAQGLAYLLTHRSWTSRIGTGFRKWSFSRPRRLVVTRPASSSTRRCFITPKRVIGSRSSSALSVCPSSVYSSSSRLRRVGSARALNTSSMPVMIGDLLVTCQPDDFSGVRQSLMGDPNATKEAVPMPDHDVGTREEWLAARRELLEREKVLTRESDELARQRQALPWVPVDEEYEFETSEGTKTLKDLFGGRSQLIVYHLMFGPDDAEACPGCSFTADTFEGAVTHLEQRDV